MSVTWCECGGGARGVEGNEVGWFIYNVLITWYICMHKCTGTKS